MTGEQMINSEAFDDATLSSISTYVEKEEHLIGSLTVRETIEFAEKLALAESVSAPQRRERVEDMLRELGLVPVENSYVGVPFKGSISIGQKRRLITATQLVTLPKIVFLSFISRYI
jgi:ATP-binding cassette, subfamily G (WHITE), member 2